MSLGSVRKSILKLKKKNCAKEEKNKQYLKKSEKKKKEGPHGISHLSYHIHQIHQYFVKRYNLVKYKAIKSYNKCTVTIFSCQPLPFLLSLQAEPELIY